MNEPRFPFGEPVRALRQEDRSPKRVFVLGVYASAVHARWELPNGSGVQALAVASEPTIFWPGDGAEKIIERIEVPAAAGRLSVADERFNGPSGRALDELYLGKLGLSRSDAWLCDLLPESRVNPAQARAIERQYDPLVRQGVVPPASVPLVPKHAFVDDKRRQEIVDELLASKATTLITLGDAPLREFANPLGLSRARLKAFGTTPERYGQLYDTLINGRSWLRLLPLAHPRQASELGMSSPLWTTLHTTWANEIAHTLSVE